MKQDKQPEKTDYDFDYSEWIGIYPEFETKVSPTRANNYAELCVSYFNPTKVKSVVCDQRERKNLFYLLVAHYAALQARNSDGGAQLGGVINSVSEGSIAIGSDTSGLSKIDPWFAQSSYGQAFWALSKKYRSGLYIRPIPDPRLRIIP
ncbi:DUF4054 domain-containing protein [Commensalibacter communis]|uniref:DUF4054 domain-containing protein n=1 Tax=Commensalibacter communis TaxID=2972786 RepID=UPI0022FF92E0|nr:DUF4054 domain-containing protein [Commensalibacter communis]CAI3933477.1 unnamed protein product [Commensalibacter communis]CAI3944726.1 unnamed protein product [Commensalibacter communis]